MPTCCVSMISCQSFPGQLEPMEAQAEKAKVYLKKREELKEYDVNLFLLELEEFQKKNRMQTKAV